MDNKLKVTVQQGTLRGTYYKSTWNGNVYSAFLGIPYAEAPVKDLRFKPPVPLEKWNGILNAITDKEDCMQYSFFENKVIGSEDCLYLNVFTPAPPQDMKQLKPVIVHIHCGGYYWGSGTTECFGAPDFIVHHDVVYVVVNYRLHVFGFLNLNLPECAGNMGLKDQVLALKWVQQNIKYFGGDPNNVTLHGSSSGASAIHLHMMSPMSRGLFHKVIMQSGYGLSPSWSIMENPIGTALEFGRILGFKGDSVEQLYALLKKKTAADLVVALRELREEQFKRIKARLHITPFIPSVEMFEEGSFLTQAPSNLIYNTISVPMMCSLCEVEGVALLLGGPIEEIEKMGLREIVKNHLWLYKMDDETLDFVTKQIKQYYFDSESNHSKLYNKYLDLYCDLFTCEWQNMIDFQSREADVYVFLFMFEGELNFQKNIFLHEYRNKIKGTFHGDDAAYFVHAKRLFGEIKRNKEKIVILNMTTALTNFAKFGKPDNGKINWRRHTPENPCYVKFNVGLEVVDGIINERRITFWKGLMEYIRKNEKKIVDKK